MRSFYQNISSPSYERYFFTTSTGGRITYGIYIYRATDGNDTWHIKKGSYYSDDLKMAREGRCEFIKYLGKADLDTDVCNLIFEKCKKLKREARSAL